MGGNHVIGFNNSKIADGVGHERWLAWFKTEVPISTIPQLIKAIPLRHVPESPAIIG